MKKISILFHTQAKQIPRDRITKSKTTRASGWVGWRYFDTKQYIFFKKRHTKFYYEE